MPLRGHHGQVVLQLGYSLNCRTAAAAEAAAAATANTTTTTTNNNKAFGNQLSHSRYKIGGLLYSAKEPARNFVTFYRKLCGQD